MVQFDDSFSDARVKELRALEEERLIRATAPRLGFEYVNLQEITLNPDALSVITEKEAREAFAVSFQLNQRVVSLAVKNPNFPATLELIKRLEKQRYTVLVYMCSVYGLEYIWKRYADVVKSSAEQKGMFSLDPAHTLELISNIKQKSDISTLLKKVGATNSARRISETLSLIFAGSLALRASDIHIEPEEKAVRLRYRLDGVLHDIIDLDRYIFDRIMSRLKLLSGMVLNVKMSAQDGRFTFTVGEREIEIRSSVIPGALGESIVMRILDPSVASFTMDSLRLNKYIFGLFYV